MATINEESFDAGVGHSASPREQLATWHAGRGNKSFLRAMIPSWKVPEQEGERETRNPFKLVGMVSPLAWLMFFS
jgi:SHS family lactate transporter-like MFS transporter